MSHFSLYSKSKLFGRFSNPVEEEDLASDKQFLKVWEKVQQPSSFSFFVEFTHVLAYLNYGIGNLPNGFVVLCIIYSGGAGVRSRVGKTKNRKCDLFYWSGFSISVPSWLCQTTT